MAPKSTLSRGFTMIELLIVLTLVAVLATAAAGVMQSQSAAARRVATQETAHQVSQAVGIFRQQTGVLPDLISSWDPLTVGGTYNGRSVGPLLPRPPRNALIPSSGNPSCISDGNLPVLYIEQCAFLYDYNGGNGTGRFIAAYSAKPSAKVMDAGALAAEKAALAE